MRDFLGNEIEINDTVVCAVGHGRNSGASLVKFVVTGFTKTFVNGEIPDYTGYVGQFSQTKVMPGKCVVIKKGDQP